MTRLALVHPTGLLATELRDGLDRRRDLWQELRLLSDDAEDIGGLTEVRGEAAVISALDDTSLGGVDVAFFAGPAESARSLVPKLPRGARAIVLSPDAGAEDGHPVVAGINLESAADDHPVLVSPHPGAIALSHLLAPLVTFQPERMAVTLMQPISVRGHRGLDEVFEQTRSILAFSSESPREVFQTQMAFNMLPVEPQPQIVAHLQNVLGLEFPSSIQVLQAAIFHSYGVSLHLDLGNDPGAEAVRDALTAHPFIDASPDPELLGPIDAAARDEIILGDVTPVANRPGSYQIWAVMDNITCGGALNAMQILEAIRPAGTH